MKQSLQSYLVLPSVLSLTVAAFVSGCGGGGGGGSSVPQAELTTEKVTEEIDDIVDTVANCDKTGTMMIGSTGGRQINDILTVSRSLAANAESDGETQKLVIRPSANSGNCLGRAGSVTVSSTHANGDTTYELDFNAYCTDGPEGETVITGMVEAIEDGTGTPAGPEVSALKLSTDDLQMDFKDANGSDQTAHVSISGARTDYGKPAIRGADVPTEDAPDSTTVSKITIDVITKAETHEITNLSMSRYGDTTATVSIEKGRYISPDNESVDISTPENKPLVIDINTGEVSDGSVMLEGRNDSVALIEPTGDSRVVSVTVNGETLSSDVDCSNTDAGVTEVIGVLLSNLPLGYN